VKSAAHYGLFDLDRLERLVLRNIASEYFVAPSDFQLTCQSEEVAHEG
jgi:hypothetical protein